MAIEHLDESHNSHTTSAQSNSHKMASYGAIYGIHTPQYSSFGRTAIPQWAPELSSDAKGIAVAETSIYTLVVNTEALKQ